MTQCLKKVNFSYAFICKKIGFSFKLVLLAIGSYIILFWYIIGILSDNFS